MYIIPQRGFNVKDARVSFNSNGDRIYLTASSDRGTNIQGLFWLNRHRHFPTLRSHDG
ncbi:hypothetical protein [Microcoleus sp. EPA2]|uniref:hypothetical protein n=1 Tax=Microcoleus sp. EPA2 TaxID=2841654 RepID=UPI00312BA1E9